MLSLDLFDSKYEKKLHEGAVDNTIEHLLKPLSLRAADIRTQLRSGRLDPKQVAKLEKEYEDLVQKRLDIILDRRPKNEQQVPSKQDAFAYVKPQPKGIGDIQDPRAKMASLAQKAKKGPLANVGAGLKGFLTGKDEPLDEQEPQQSPRAFGVANFQRLVKANMGNYPKLDFEFANAKDNIKLDKHGIDLISDYYDGLENDQAKNYFIYRVLPSADETRKILKSLGWHEQRQQELPGIPTQGELPLSEDQKKKSNADDLKATDVKTAREIQKIRAQYPAAGSDIEALARAELDNTERSQQQLGRIRNSNARQDELLKQIMDIDREQNREIDNLDSEKDSIEAQLNRVQSLNNRLTKAVAQMSGARTAKKTSTVSTKPAKTIDLIPGAPADSNQSAQQSPAAKPRTEPTPAPVSKPEPDVVGSMARTIQSLPKDAPETSKDPEELEKEPEEKPVGSLKSLRPKQSANVDDFQLVAEAKEIKTRQDFIQERDRLLRMITQETNPVNKQILKSAIRQLEGRAEAEGWIVMQQRMIRENNDSKAAEQAILKRIMVAHTDLLRQYGPEKVMQAAEEVAYNVGDLGEIGSSDVSGWVRQVEYILGARPEGQNLQEKWSEKYKKSINCANPKGFSQRAHCAGKKKK